MKNRSLIAVSFIAIMFSTALPSVAYSAVVYDAITVRDNGGNIISSVTATLAEINANPNAIFYVPGVAVDSNMFGNYGVVIDSGIAVDIFGIASGGPDGLNLAFGPGGQASNYTVQNPVFSTGSPIDLTSYLAPSLQASGTTAFFTASGDITIAGVPEPATWAMMLVGFGAIGISKRRNQRQAVRYNFA